MSYDAWKTRSPEDEEYRRVPRLVECDLCGGMKPSCRLVEAYGSIRIICEKCLGEEPDAEEK